MSTVVSTPGSGAFPDGTRLLHIGPHKTGTTALQSAFWAARDRLATYDVLWAGGEVHPLDAAIAATTGGGIATTLGDEVLRRWRELVDEVRDADARMTLVSSEFFSEATPERAAAIVDDLGGERVQVVITLRPLTRILASQWQQFMQNQPAAQYPGNPGFEGWLEIILGDLEQREMTPSFWVRHRHDLLVRRWAEVVGEDRVTVVVVDDARPTGLLESFERLAGVPVGTVEPVRSSGNRSLTYPEVTLLRAFNARWMAEGRDIADYTRFVRWRGVRHVLERPPAPGEAPINTPTWAIDRANEIGAEMVERIRDTGVRIDGDLGLLSSSAPRAVGDNPPDVAVPAEVAARFAAGLVKAIVGTLPENARAHRRLGPLEDAVRRSKMARVESGELRGVDRRYRRGDRRLVADLGRRELLRVLAGRARHRLRARLGERRSAS